MAGYLWRPASCHLRLTIVLQLLVFLDSALALRGPHDVIKDAVDDQLKDGSTAMEAAKKMVTESNDLISGLKKQYYRGTLLGEIVDDYKRMIKHEADDTRRRGADIDRTLRRLETEITVEADDSKTKLKRAVKKISHKPTSDFDLMNDYRLRPMDELNQVMKWTPPR